MLILTGQRREEIGGLRFDVNSYEVIVPPERRTKNPRAHLIALCAPAQAILNGVGTRGRPRVQRRQALLALWRQYFRPPLEDRGANTGALDEQAQ